MENITQGHWIFAFIFVVCFSTFIFFAYKKDHKTHKIHYSGVIYFVLILISIFILAYIFKDFLK